MKVFVSWSGERSKALGMILRDLLPLVLHYVKPWLSESDISAGKRWSSEVAEQLQESQFGIICLTKENVTAPWVLFEAGALAKHVATSSVCPYLLDIDYRDLSGPLAQFQAKKSDSEATLELITAINNAGEQKIENDRITRLFGALWPDFHRQLLAIPESKDRPKPIRSNEDVLEELILSVRDLERRFSDSAVGTVLKAKSLGPGVHDTLDQLSRTMAESLLPAVKELGRASRDLPENRRLTRLLDRTLKNLDMLRDLIASLRKLDIPYE